MKLKAYITPDGANLERVCTAACRDYINEQFDAVWNETGRPYNSAELAEIGRDAEVIITSWRTKPFTEEMLASSTKLRYFAHAAGSLKLTIPKTIFDGGVRVFSAAPRLAQSVGEYCLAVLLTSLRHIAVFDRASRIGEGAAIRLARRGHELTGNRVGVISASSTARAFIQLLTPFRPTILLCDPYLSEESARQLGVQLASLEEVMRCPIISIHAPNIPATTGMIGAELLRLIPNGAVLINSARAAVVDEAALLAELQSGRFYAALDVFIKEPITQESPFAELDNILITPHVAGNTIECHSSLMIEVAQDVVHAMNGEPTRYEVSKQRWDVIG